MTTSKEHPLVPRFREEMTKGKMDRREFVRLAALLGVSAGAAYAMAGIPSPAWSQASLPFPEPEPGAKQGGAIRIGMQIQKMDDPHTYSWIEASNQSRPIIEYLSITGPDNVTRPMLLERWEASDDLATWTLFVRPGVMWHNGEELTAEHVAWNIRRWLDPATGSSNIGLSTFASLVEETGQMDEKGKPIKKAIANAVEVLDKHTLRLNLAKPVLSMPEDCYNYPTAILHPSFKAPFSDNPIGTGPYTLAELVVGERCSVRRVTETTDGKPFTYWGGDVYLDEIQFFNFSNENQLTALQSGEVDAIYEFSVEQLELARAVDAEVLTAETAQAICCRMQVDKPPFDDIRIRQAVVKSVDNAVIKNLTFPEGGSVGENHMVAPVHPEYFPLPLPPRDVEGAKRLLAEAGHPNGIDLEIAVGNTDGPWHQTVCEVMRDQMKEAGINLTINVMPPSKYWEVWLDAPFGATSWAHRPLGTMVLSLAFRKGVPWNESHYNNPEFEAALNEAEATFDVEERRQKMERVEKILQDDAVVVQPLLRPVYTMAARRVHGYTAHPARYMQFNKVWVG